MPDATQLTSVATDGWRVLIEDIDRAIQKFAKITTASTEDLRKAIKGDILPMLRDTMANVMQLRDNVYPAINAMADHLDDLEERMAGFDGIASDTQLLPEDADLILKVAGGAKLLCAELIKTATGDGRVKLDEMIAMCDELEQLAQNKRLDTAEDEDEDGEGDDEADGDDNAEGDVQPGGTQQ